MKLDEYGVELSGSESSTEALDLAGLNWEVESFPVEYERGKVLGAKLLGFRKSPGGEVHQIGLVSLDWEPLQNAVFVESMKSACDREGYELKRLGLFRLFGRSTFTAQTIVFGIGQDTRVTAIAGEDYRRKLVITNGHNYGQGINLAAYIERQVCSNGMVVRGEKNLRYTLSHTSCGLGAFPRILRQIETQEDLVSDLLEALREERLPDREAMTIISRLTDNRNVPWSDKHAIAQTIFAIYRGDYDNAPGLPTLGQREVYGTRYGLLQAFTAYSNHFNSATQAAGLSFLQGQTRAFQIRAYADITGQKTKKTLRRQSVVQRML